MQDQPDDCSRECRGQWRVALQQTKRRCATERVDHQIDIGVGTKLAAFDGTPQDATGDLASTVGEFGKEGGPGLWIQLRFGKQADEGLPGNRLRLQPNNRVGDVAEVAFDAPGIWFAKV